MNTKWFWLKHLYPDGSGILQDDNASIHRARGVSEWFDEYENYVNHMLWLSQSPDLNPIEHLWEILDRCVRQGSSPTPNVGISLERMVFILPVEFRECRINDMVHWSCSGGTWWPNTLLRHFLLSVGYLQSTMWCSSHQILFWEQTKPYVEMKCVQKFKQMKNLKLWFLWC